jgi:PAS domain S-box-containing protein
MDDDCVAAGRRPEVRNPDLNGGGATEALAFLGRGGEMGARMRAFDWATTPLGPPGEWPRSLKTVVRILLDSRYPMWMLWGPELTFFCNDAYLPTVGIKRDWVLGARSDRVWAEIWPDIGPRIDHVLATGEATWDEALLLVLERSGYPEETYHTFSYSPVYGDDAHVAGVLCVVTEDTGRQLSERRMALLGALGTDLAAMQSEAEVVAALRRHMDNGLPDLPGALVYLADADRLQCVFRAGFDAAHPLALQEIPLHAAPWPITEVLASGESRLVELDPQEGVPHGPWREPAKAALLLPLGQPGHHRTAGVLVACLNRYRVLDESYRHFLGLVAAQIAAALANARSYAALRRRAEALADLDRAKTAFFSNVSHEFRTPLTLMMGPLEDVLDRGKLPENLRTELDVVHRNSLRLLKLVNSLLDFFQVESGRLQARYARVHIGALTAELAGVFRSAIERAGLALEIDCESIADAYVDRDMWEKLVFNLLSNALKHTLHGRITVRVAARDDAFTLVVGDTGVGIPEEALPHIFDRFYRVPNARSRTYEGSGIGLALVQAFAKLHGGSVDVASALDVGTTFTVTLPRGFAHLPPERLVTEQAPEARRRSNVDAFVDEARSWDSDFVAPPAPGELPADAPTVLLVDDSADMRDYVSRLLSTRFRVVTAADGVEALAIAGRALPDLVLSDVMMPRLDGFGLLKALRDDERTRELPVVLLSARAGEEAWIEGIDAGADDYLVKPFSARELHARIANNLAMARVRRQYVQATRAGEARRRFLLEFADGLRAAQTPEEVAGTAVAMIGRELRATTAGYLEVEREGRFFRVVSEWRGDGIAPRHEGARFPIDRFGEEEARMSGLPIVIDDTRSHPRASAWLAEGAGAVMTAPRVMSGRSPAALWVTMDGPRAWHADEIALLREAAERTWAELSRARAETKLRESEERFRTMADSSPLFVWVLDPDGRLVFANRAVRDFFGEGELDDDDWAKHIHPDDVDGYAAEIAAALAEQRPFSVMARVRRSDGAWRWIQSIGAPRFSDDGQFLGAVGSSPDITELIEASDALRDADRRKDEFVATLAHELRNPLAPIRQASRVARSADASEAQRAWSHEVIDRQVRHMGLLLDDLLDVSRITRGKLELRRERVALERIVDVALETAQPLLDERRQRVVRALPREPVWLHADALRMAQVLANLLTNAAKYSEPRGTVELGAAVRGREIGIYVQDNGIGIEPALLPRVFDMFSQMKGSLDRAEGGLGIGLALVKGLVELHGGRVEAQSAGPGTGARFTVHLPLSPGMPLARSEQDEVLPAPRIETHARILIADDNGDAASSLATLLSLDGHEVRVANDGDQALAEAARFRPQVALLDIGMPRKNGYEVASTMRATPWGRSMLLVAVTGWGQTEDKRRAKEAGFDRHFTKPLDLDALTAFLSRALAARSGE